MADSLRTQTLALIGQEFLANALASGGSMDSAVASMLLYTGQPTSGREKAATALTGRIRSDSGMMRQASQNAAEGATMATLIKDATLTLGEKLSALQTVVQSYQAGQMTGAEAKDAFANIARNISATVSGTAYNGISLLDKSGWDSRLTPSDTDNTASLSIQLGNAASTFTVRDLSDLKRFASIDVTTLTAQELSDLVTGISTDIASVTAMSSGYESLAGSYTADAKYFENQAELLAATAAQTIKAASREDGSSSGQSVQSILIDLLLRDQGKIVDTSS